MGRWAGQWRQAKGWLSGQGGRRPGAGAAARVSGLGAAIHAHVPDQCLTAAPTMPHLLQRLQGLRVAIVFIIPAEHDGVSAALWLLRRLSEGAARMGQERGQCSTAAGSPLEALS